MRVAANEHEAGRRRGSSLANTQCLAAARWQLAKNALLIDRLATANHVSHFAEQVNVLKEGREAVVILLADRIELVIVAASTSQRQPEHRRAGCAHNIVQLVSLGLFAVVRLIVPDA